MNGTNIAQFHVLPKIFQDLPSSQCVCICVSVGVYVWMFAVLFATDFMHAERHKICKYKKTEFCVVFLR